MKFLSFFQLYYNLCCAQQEKRNAAVRICSECVSEKQMICDMKVSEADFPQTIYVGGQDRGGGNEYRNLIKTHELNLQG